MLLLSLKLFSASWLRLFYYVTFRSLIALLFSLLCSILIGKRFISILVSMNFRQVVRANLKSGYHATKNGTPTMGGLMIIIVTCLSTILFADLSNGFIWLLLFIMVIFGAIGFADDYKKIYQYSSRGINARVKFTLQLIFASIVIYILYYVLELGTLKQILVPFMKNNIFIVPSWLLILIALFAIVGSSNAVNLTDGLDGLVSFPVINILIGLSVFAYLSANRIFSAHLLLPHIIGVQEIVIFCSCLIGSCLGFLWFNIYPAMMFMGDVGALSIGAVIGTIAVILQQEIAYIIISGVLVVEVLSVILQVIWYKMTSKRLFSMAPLHHHFELNGWKENQTVVRFWIISTVLLVIGLATIKLR